MRTVVWCSMMLTTIACTNSQTKISENNIELKKIDQAHWLIGSWYSEFPEGITYEVWKEINDTTFVGTSYSVRDTDTITSEFIRLEQKGKEMAYIPTVPDQNMGTPVEFKLTFIDRNKMVFENPDHDFPQMIIYHRVSTDSLVAEISGMVKGEHRARQFPMRRSKKS